MKEDLRRKELAVFLKNRRKRLSPHEAGLPETGGRRRISGLRREEVAALSGISLPWYAALEQGRDIKVSDSVLDSLAHTLRLQHDERIHLYMLAERKVPLEAKAASPQMNVTNSELQLIVDQFNHYPAYVMDGKWNIAIWNQTAEELFGGFGQGKCDRNLIWLMFTDPVFSKRFIDWETSAGKIIAAFRTAFARHMEDPCLSEIIGDLGEVSSKFNLFWERYDVQGGYDNHFSLQHPDIGEIGLNSIMFHPNEREDRTLVLYTPVGAQDDGKLQHLHKRA
ncbi:helix-turn-helix transcriptional regulator [Paenibacillus sp. P96]|uniref:Helix-turn-helix transcriptional regulator n=1 Tax=Paenibacillus zeirhizosphaerae TaxID=2987519 RepID=A0ABT9FQ07_9BACL|nr:helix-turn-helix transcriptional regulator [Paenibacillus sp. P96]MDP4096799.1 helix-turn-helix transcriptional regulator [Paenibacillus sp. P96]